MSVSRIKAVVIRLLVLAAVLLAASPSWAVQGSTVNEGAPVLNFIAVVRSTYVAPVILPIDNPDRDGLYTITWYEPQNPPDSSYFIEEATNPSFAGSQQICGWVGNTCEVSRRATGTYYYRVKAISGYGTSPWSLPATVKVICGYMQISKPVSYNLDLIKAPTAWNCTQGGDGVIIAIIDSGISASNEIIDNLISGMSFVPGNPSTIDDYGSGSHVAGIAAAWPEEYFGSGVLIGVAPRASLMPVKVLDSTGGAYTSWIANVIIWAVEHGARVLNIGLNIGFDSYFIRTATAYAYDKGAVVVAPAGDCGDNTWLSRACGYLNAPNYPAAYDWVLAVAATDYNDAKASFSTAADYLDVSAPGVDIRSIFREGYPPVTVSGGAQAAAHVSGLAALILKLRPNWIPAQVYVQIRQSSKDLTAYGAGWDNKTGWGRIDCQAAIADILPFESATEILDAQAAAAKQVVTAKNSQDPTEFRPGAVLFKLSAGAGGEAVNGLAEIQAAGLQVVSAIEALDVLELQVPIGEETQWLAYLRSLPEVEYAELDGLERAH